MVLPMGKINQPPLKPCPFCKGKAVRQCHDYTGRLLGMEPNPSMPLQPKPIWEKLRWHIVKCADCGVAQPKRKYNSRQESDDAWNNRPE